MKSLNEKYRTEKKYFWKTVKVFLVKQVTKEHRITTLKAIAKHRKHPSVIAITSKCTKNAFLLI